MSTTIGPGAGEHLVAFADDEHLMGQQHTEWIGVAPFLEEDLAFSSIAQDELGHAAALYELLGEPDTLAFGRRQDQYRSCHLVELPCQDWADALARHWLYDLAEVRRWDALAGSAVAEVAALVARATREEE
ncbi:MAG: phenylacetate-CoA oxygenase subunit PaaI, partial [Acidimicrobiia bacterium]|nr:phenylacetate-CoA oxygenase subunit PaaI [Acidimicrobiia bacterium]